MCVRSTVGNILQDKNDNMSQAEENDSAEIFSVNYEQITLFFTFVKF